MHFNFEVSIVTIVFFLTFVRCAKFLLFWHINAIDLEPSILIVVLLVKEGVFVETPSNWMFN